MIYVKNVRGGYGSSPIIDQVSLHVKKGEFFTLLGPNGSGKSTLFKLITGVLPLSSGEIQLAGKNLQQISLVDRARRIAVLGQEERVGFDFTVEEIVMLGRYPHQKGWLKSISAADRQAVDRAMEVCKVRAYRHKSFAELSGGEKQRVLLAKALAQEPQVLLLDEPTNHLDIRHTFDLLGLLKTWQQTHELTILAILHDLNIASLYADRVALLSNGRIVEIGDVHTLRNEHRLQEVYGVTVHAGSHPELAKPQLFLTPQQKEIIHEHDPFSTWFRVKQDDKVMHITSKQPLRTISSGVIGDGLGWSQHFCNFHVDKHYDCSDPATDVRHWLQELNIPAEQTVAMMTAVNLNDHIMLIRDEPSWSCVVVVTAGVGNAVDITAQTEPEAVRRIGTINTMLFLDGHLTDGGLCNAMLSATEAKTKAMHELKVKDKGSGTIATGTSTDSLLIACSQRGAATPYAGSGTLVGKRIGQLVYEATVKAVRQYEKRLDGRS